MLYVDDFLTIQDASTIDVTAVLMLAFCVCFDIPLSWRKLEVGPTVVWIGWSLLFRAGCFSIPQSNKLRSYIADRWRCTSVTCTRWQA